MLLEVRDLLGVGAGAAVDADGIAIGLLFEAQVGVGIGPRPSVAVGAAVKLLDGRMIARVPGFVSQGCDPVGRQGSAAARGRGPNPPFPTRE